MLAARHGKNHARVPHDGVVQCIIRRSIAGVKRHHHIHRRIRAVSVNVSHLKMQILIAVLFRGGIAVLNHVRFQVKPCNLHVSFLNLRKIVIQHECQVRFSTAKINDVKCF